MGIDGYITTYNNDTCSVVCVVAVVVSVVVVVAVLCSSSFSSNMQGVTSGAGVVSLMVQG